MKKMKGYEYFRKALYISRQLFFTSANMQYRKKWLQIKFDSHMFEGV